jgi:Putative DNA-binding domain
MPVTQTAFRSALLDPGQPVPQGLTTPDGAPATRRFAVYRNNVAASLTEALETAFPLLRRLLGEDFFRAMAGVHLRAHPPRSPLLMHYGADMPAFLAAFPPVAHLPYLPDVARLELARRASYHAADSAPFDPATLAGQDLASLCLTPPAHLHLIRSRHPLHAIWAANTGGPAGPLPPGPQSVLVTRPGFDPVVDLLPEPDAACLAALLGGTPLGAALPEGHDPAALFALLIRRQAIAALAVDPTEPRTDAIPT